jgi:serine/threonine protein phosphatase 1
LHWLRDSKDNLMWYKHGGSNCTCLWKVNSVTKQLHVDFLLSLKDYYLDEKNRLLFTQDLPTWMALLMNFFQSYFIGTEPYGKLHCL